jgi:hypothetical protein
MSKNLNQSRKTQIEKFKEAARTVGTNDSEEQFDRVLGKIAKNAPKPKSDEPKKSSK